MAKNDAEIKLKINMPPPSDFKRALATAQKLQKEMAESWSSFSNDAGAQANYAKNVMAAAQGTKLRRVLATTYEPTNYNMLPVDALESVGKIKRADTNISKISAAVESGDMTEAEGINKLREVYKLLKGEKEQLVKLEERYNELVAANKGAQWAYELVEGMRAQIDAGEAMYDAMKAQEAEYLRLAEAEREYREGLDETSETYAQDVAVAKQREVYFKRAAQAQGREAAMLQAKVESTREALEVEGDQFKLEAARGGLLEQTIKAKEKSLQISDDVQVKHAQWAAADEKAKNAAEDAAKREAQLLEDKAKREEEYAKKEREREEIEQFNMQLSLLNKDQLIKKLRELQAAREAASKAGDAETYKKRTREFMAVREQMEKVNVQLNITRLAWTQQTQLANQFAGSLNGVVDRLANFGEAAENGQMDLTGLLGEAQEAGSEFMAMMQNGMNAMSVLQLGLQVFQRVWNDRAQKMQEMKRLAEEDVKRHDDVTKAIRSSREEFELFDREQRAAAGLKEQIRQHKILRADLKAELEDIEKLRRAEIARLNINKGREAHAHAMAKEELQRRYISGEISKEEYEEEIARMDRDFDLRGLDMDVEQAQAELKSAEAALEAIQAKHDNRADEAAKYSEANQRQKFGMTGERASFLDKRYTTLEDKWNALDESYKKREKEGADDAELKDIAHEMNRVGEEMAVVQHELKPVLERYFGRKIKMSEVPKLYRIFMADMRAFEQARQEAEAEEQASIQEWDAAQVRVNDAKDALSAAQMNQYEEGVRVRERYDSGVKTRKAQRKADKKKEKTAKQLQDLSNKADALTEEELRAKLEAARVARDNAKTEHEREVAEQQAKMYSKKLKGRKERERERLKAAKAENDLQQSAAARAAYEKLDLQGALDTMDDGKLTRGEVSMLLRQLKLAQQADNKVAQELIWGLVQEAMESKKMSAKYKREVLKAFER